MKKQRAHDPMYDSARWIHLHDVIMRRDKYLCRESARYGKHVEAEVVHHIFPREYFPEYQWEPWNLIALSRAEHRRMHTPDGGLTDQGMAWLKRTARKQNITKWM